YYAAQKMARAIGTNAIDNAARVCHAPSTAGLKEAVGVAATTCSYEDWIGSDLVVFIGSNVANSQPVSMKVGTKVAVVNEPAENVSPDHRLRSPCGPMANRSGMSMITQSFAAIGRR
ncbi:MAG: molybdopterin-dependent oxidoreductase, partial [Actinobacteria bacterium]|nr:molybdopterin-dependent oxidoreductase [Actinomycetota bacterium]